MCKILQWIFPSREGFLFWVLYWLLRCMPATVLSTWQILHLIFTTTIWSRLILTPSKDKESEALRGQGICLRLASIQNPRLMDPQADGYGHWHTLCFHQPINSQHHRHQGLAIWSNTLVKHITKKEARHFMIFLNVINQIQRRVY